MDPQCPINCGTPLPIVEFDNCAPQVNLSEIEYILIAKSTAADITDIDNAAEWTERLSNTSSDGDAIRQIRVTGDLPAPTDNEVTISGQRKIVIDRTYVINADVDESNDTNHESFRELQCGGIFKMWFVTRSGHIFGGNTGIIDVSLKVNLNLARGENAIQLYNFVLTWKNKFMPERTKWVNAGTNISNPTYSFYYGSGDVPTDDESVLEGTQGTAIQGQKLTVPSGGFGNGSDEICWVAEVSTEPAKTEWYNSVINNGPIGAGETFLAGVTAGSFRVYATAEATTFTGAVELRP